MNNKVADYAKHLDFLIALGAALGGSSGLGILASPWMAVPCSIITGASIILGAAKQAYNWPDKTKFCLDMMNRNSVICSQCRNIFQDLQVTKAWNSNFEQQFKELMKQIDDLPINPYPELDLKTRKQLQAEIIRRETPDNPEMWWMPDRVDRTNLETQK